MKLKKKPVPSRVQQTWTDEREIEFYNLFELANGVETGKVLSTSRFFLLWIAIGAKHCQITGYNIGQSHDLDREFTPLYSTNTIFRELTMGLLPVLGMLWL